MGERTDSESAIFSPASPRSVDAEKTSRRHPTRPYARSRAIGSCALTTLEKTVIFRVPFFSADGQDDGHAASSREDQRDASDTREMSETPDGDTSGTPRGMIENRLRF